MNVKCINLDWLEIFAEEPANEVHNAEYFRVKGYKVKERVYGTPQYREMFTIYSGKEELFEIRRNPYSLKSEGGIFKPNACHIRLCNRTCYELDPIAHLRAFMTAHDYTYVSISRIDIALDFNIFDNGMKPANFIMQYMRGKLSKINQSNVSAHGSDQWSGRVFNSLKWGSPSSPVSTKLYNKTLELKQGEDKPYIRQRWADAGLDQAQDVWRVEFSLSSQMQSLKSLKTGEVFRKSIMHYDSRERLLRQFFILYNKYFDFRRLKTNRKSDGTLVYVRKYLCPRLDLFKVADAEPYAPTRNITKKKRPDRIWKIIINRLDKIVDDDKEVVATRRAALAILSWCAQRMQVEVNDTRLDFMKLCETVDYIKNAPDFKQMQTWCQEDGEMRVLHHLMRKYGIVTPPLDCPF